MSSSHSLAIDDESAPGCAVAAPSAARAASVWAPAHLGGLSEHLPVDLVDRALDATGKREVRVRMLPSRVVVYFVLALAMFPELGYRSVFTKLCLGTGALASVTGSALTQARRRIGVQPLRWLFDLLRGPAPCTTREGSWFRSYRICAIDGTILTLPDTTQIQTKYGKQAGNHGGTGYPQARMVALIACGTRTIIDAVFGPTSIGETTYTPALLPAMAPGMIILADRNFASAKLLHQIRAAGADFLVRVKNGRNLPVHRQLADPREGTARELMGLYHERWEIETAFREIKSTLLQGRVLRSRTVQLVEQEIYALLIVEQLLRTVMSEATNTVPGLDPDRASFTIALSTAKDLFILGPAASTRQPQHTGWQALAGTIGTHVLDRLLPKRRMRTGTRTVKRAISKHQARASKPHGPTRNATLSVEILNTGALLTPTAKA